MLCLFCFYLFIIKIKSNVTFTDEFPNMRSKKKKMTENLKSIIYHI